MKKNNFVIFSAKGEKSFDPKLVRQITSQYDGQFVKAIKPPSEKSIIKLCRHAKMIGITPRVSGAFTEKMLDQLPKLKTVALPTTGTEWLDLKIFKKRKIIVTNVPNFSSVAGAEFTIGILIAISRNLFAAAKALKSKPTHSLIGHNLKEKTLGIVGYGNIGKQVARLAHTFGMKVLYYDPYVNKTSRYAKKSGLTKLVNTCDFISIHCPLTDETSTLFTKDLFFKMKRGTYLINTARPQIINTDFLMWAIRKQYVKNYVVDIGYLKKKQITPLLKNKQVTVLPHISWYTHESVELEMQLWLKTIQSILSGKTKNRIV